MVFSTSRSSRYMLRLNAWSTHFCARAATSMKAYGETEKLVFQFRYQVVVHVQIFSGNFIAAESLGKPWVNTRSCSGYQANVGVWRHGHQGGIAHAVFHLAAQRVPIKPVLLDLFINIKLHAALFFQLGNGVHRHLSF